MGHDHIAWWTDQNVSFNNAQIKSNIDDCIHTIKYGLNTKLQI